MSHPEKCHQNRGVPQNAYRLKLKSIKRTILHEIYITKGPILGFFLLFNFQIDSALTFSSGLIYVSSLGRGIASPFFVSFLFFYS